MDSEGQRYRNAVNVLNAIEVLRDMRWQKTPGKDQITASYLSEGDDSVVSPVLVVAQVELTNEQRETNKVIFDDDNNRLVIEGNDLIAFMVNRVGIDFNGADSYREKGIGK